MNHFISELLGKILRLEVDGLWKKGTINGKELSHDVS